MREKMEKEIVTLACVSFLEEFRFRLETNIAMQEVCIGKNNFYRLFELDEEFHQILFQGTGKLRTWKMLQQLNIPFSVAFITSSGGLQPGGHYLPAQRDLSSYHSASDRASCSGDGSSS